MRGTPETSDWPIYRHVEPPHCRKHCRSAPIMSGQSLPTLPHGGRGTTAGTAVATLPPQRTPPRATLPKSVDSLGPDTANTSRHCHWPHCFNTADRPIRCLRCSSHIGPPRHCRFTVFWQWRQWCPPHISSQTFRHFVIADISGSQICRPTNRPIFRFGVQISFGVSNRSVYRIKVSAQFDPSVSYGTSIGQNPFTGISDCKRILKS